MPSLPPLRSSWAPTFGALQSYARAAVAVPRANGEPRPHWGHAGFELTDDELVSTSVALPDGSSLSVRFDLARAAIHLERGGTAEESFSMVSGPTPTEVGDRIVEIAAAHGVDVDVDRARYAVDPAAGVDQDAAFGLREALLAAASIFRGHAAALPGEVGKLHFWAHHFDLSVEWYGTREVEFDEDGEMYPTQINLGLYVQDRPYFYSNPWPFDRSLMDTALPHSAAWTVDEFEGSILYYDQIADDPDANDKIADYARAVWDAASPGLMA